MGQVAELLDSYMNDGDDDDILEELSVKCWTVFIWHQKGFSCGLL
jgi:hypothetical protein